MARSSALRTAQHDAVFGMSAMPLRCGSFPLMNLAADFGVEYGDVLELSQAAGAGRFWSLSHDRRLQIADASLRLEQALGAKGYDALYARLKAVTYR